MYILTKKITNLIFFLGLVLVFAVGIFFRFYNLSQVPPSPSLDEVTIGYNAFSILNTGADEYGYHLPILLRAYDDYRPSLYVYSVIPFIKLLGLNVLAVRLPSVLMSIIDLIATYFLAIILFNKLKYKKIIALVGSFLLAISPWHIYISRLGHEVNAGLTFIILGILFFLISIAAKKYRWTIIPSVIFFALSFYTYQSEKVFTPLIVIFLAICFWRSLWANKKNGLIAVIIGLIIFIPIFKVSLSPQALIRLNGTSAFSNLDSDYFKSANQLVIDKKQGNLIAVILDNRRLVPVKIFISNYFSHFNPQWLFSNSSNESFKAPNLGLFYNWEILSLLFGLFSLIFYFKDTKTKIFLLGWIFLSLVAPAITTQAPHAMRALNALPAPMLIEAFGLVKIFGFFIERWKYFYLRIVGYIFAFGFLVIIIQSCFLFFINYFFAFPYQQSESFTYALQSVLPYVLKHQSEYKKIVISNQDNLYQSYMFFLFVGHYNPWLYQKEGGTKSGGFAQTHAFGKFEFRPIKWATEQKQKTMFVGNPTDFPSNAAIKMKSYYLDGKEGVAIIY